ncbi:MAG: hypothetical protein K1X83_07090 [Oligoflexia bacterium]|nr:hypothetical protein [Oligoflexia bacterium]
MSTGESRLAESVLTSGSLRTSALETGDTAEIRIDGSLLKLRLVSAENSVLTRRKKETGKEVRCCLLMPFDTKDHKRSGMLGPYHASFVRAGRELTGEVKLHGVQVFWRKVFLDESE